MFVRLSLIFAWRQAFLKILSFMGVVRLVIQLVEMCGCRSSLRTNSQTFIWLNFVL